MRLEMAIDRARVGRDWPGSGQALASSSPTEPRGKPTMKKILELLLCILHPVAVILIWINLILRRDIGLIAKLTWAIAVIVPFVPFVYVLTGNDLI
jgi:hypothetical protein